MTKKPSEPHGSQPGLKIEKDVPVPPIEYAKGYCPPIYYYIGKNKHLFIAPDK